MTPPSGAAATADGLSGLFVRVLLDADAVALRQVPFTVAWTTAWVLGFLGAGDAADRPQMWVGLALVLGLQIAAAFLPWHRLTPSWQSVPPLAHLAAVVLLGHADGAPTPFPDALVLLPISALALRTTWPTVTLAVVAAPVVQAALAVAAPGRAAWPTSGDVVVALVALVVVLGTVGAAGTARRLRAEQGRAVEAARLEAQLRPIGRIGHDLRSPLTSVLGYAQLLGARAPADEERQFVDAIERNGRLLLRRIDELVVGVQLATGGLGIERRDVDLARIVGASRDELATRSRSAEVALEVVAPHPVPLSADPDLLALAVTGLLERALTSTSRGGEVIVHVRPRDRTDQGESSGGVLDVVAPSSIYAPDVSDQPDEAGGDGVAPYPPVVRAVVDAHRGCLEVDRVRGGQVTVTMELPNPSGRSSSAAARSTPR